MQAMALLILWWTAFVASHFFLSHPLRRGLVDRFGEKGFLAVYSLVAVASLGLAAHQYGAASVARPERLWGDNVWAWALATLLMWCASVLFVGALRGNPAMPTGGAKPEIPAPTGVFAITRHPMMWGFAIWALVHAMIVATAPALVTSGAILLLALGGAYGQDVKKKRLFGERWREWTRVTAFVPFTRGGAMPDLFALGGGTLLWLAATWAHGALGAMRAGIFRFFG